MGLRQKHVLRLIRLICSSSMQRRMPWTLDRFAKSIEYSILVPERRNSCRWQTDGGGNCVMTWRFAESTLFIPRFGIQYPCDSLHLQRERPNERPPAAIVLWIHFGHRFAATCSLWWRTDDRPLPLHHVFVFIQFSLVACDAVDRWMAQHGPLTRRPSITPSYNVVRSINQINRMTNGIRSHTLYPLSAAVELIGIVLFWQFCACNNRDSMTAHHYSFFLLSPHSQIGIRRARRSVGQARHMHCRQGEAGQGLWRGRRDCLR